MVKKHPLRAEPNIGKAECPQRKSKVIPCATYEQPLSSLFYLFFYTISSFLYGK